MSEATKSGTCDNQDNQTTASSKAATGPTDSQGAMKQLVQQMFNLSLGMSAEEAQTLVTSASQQMEATSKKFEETQQALERLEVARPDASKELKIDFDKAFNDARKNEDNVKQHLQRFLNYWDRVQLSSKGSDRKVDYTLLLYDVTAEYQLASGQLRHFCDCAQLARNKGALLTEEIKKHQREVQRMKQTAQEAGYGNAAVKIGAGAAAGAVIGGPVGVGVATTLTAHGLWQAKKTYDSVEAFNKLMDQLEDSMKSLQGCLNDLQKLTSNMEQLEAKFNQARTRLDAASKISTKEANRYRKRKLKSKSLGDLTRVEGDATDGNQGDWTGSLHDLKYEMKKSGYKGTEGKKRKKRRCVIL